MRMRPLQALGVAGLVIAAAAVGAIVMPLTASPAAPSPSATEPRPIPASPAASAARSDRYGLIVGRSLRSEADPQTLAELAAEDFYGTVSPDGRRVAYWETSRVSAPARVLRLIEGVAPARSRVVLTLPESETASTSAGGIAWSSDGTGLLIAVHLRDRATPPPPGGPPLHQAVNAALRQIDLASGSVREIARVEGGLPFRPVAWDRARAISTAVEFGPGGYATSYLVVRDGAAPVATTLLDHLTVPAGLVRAAPDASRVLAAELRGPAVHVWPLAEPERFTKLDVITGERVVTAVWRNAREIVVSLEGDTPGTDRLEVWPLEDSRRVVLRGRHRLDAVRPDGTAAIVSGQAVDLVTGATWPIPGLAGRVDASFLLR